MIGTMQILLKYKSLILKITLINTLQMVYSDHEWLPFRFSHTITPPRYWRNKNNQRKFMDWFGKELNITQWSDWYGIITKDIVKRNGRGLLSIYDKQLYKLFQSVYPEYSWEMNKFKEQKNKLRV